MDKHKPDGGKKQAIFKPRPGGTWLLRELYQSPAFTALSKNGLLVVIAAMDARQFSTIKQNGKKEKVLTNGHDIRLPYSRLEDVFHMNMAGIARGIDDAMAKGFLKLEHQGGGGKHDQSQFSLSNDFIRWTPGTVFHKRPKAIRRGFQDPACQRRRSGKENLRIMK